MRWKWAAASTLAVLFVVAALWQIPVHGASRPANLLPPRLKLAMDQDLNLQKILVDYPHEGSLFPPDIIPPLVQWREPDPRAAIWRIDVEFGNGAQHIQQWSAGEPMKVGEVDDSLVGYVPPKLTPEQAAAHTWRPDPKTWEKIKKHSVDAPATIRISGFAGKGGPAISQGQITIRTSSDPVGAPVFFRDVPLLPPPLDSTERGVIKPLPDSVLPKIKWRLRNVSETESKTVMEGLPTCANCHSISRDGKTLGIDVDGPQNNKGLYALVPIKKTMAISNDYVIHWSSFSDKPATPDAKPPQKRFGFMSQISPDAKYVITSIDVPGGKGPRVVDRLYNGFYPNYGFGQVFYPTRGVLAWYSKETGKLAPLPGADDPDYVQTSAFWSPDSKYLVYSRATARDPYAPGQKKSEYANDPNETQIQYDLYRVPFNDGKGGVAEPVLGASNNGMSNDFPKVSPDGKWIVFVRNKNGLLMRPDSQLYIVPFNGGQERRLDCNQPVMNSWHSWSPNGRWLVFSSKWPSLYTQMYLTHIDEEGRDSPAILIEHATAANRAVNIPEFMNIAPDGLDHIDAPATQFYKLFDDAVQFSEKKQYEAAAAAWAKAVAAEPDDARAHNNYGVALAASGRIKDAVAEYTRSLELNGNSAQAENNLGSALAESGDVEHARAHFEKALGLDPDNAAAHVNLGNAMAAQGQYSEAIEQLRTGLAAKPDSADGQNGLGIALAHIGQLDEAVQALRKAAQLAPSDAAFAYNLGRVLAARGTYAEAVAPLEQAVKLGPTEVEPMRMLAAMYGETGNYARAAETAKAALELARQHGDQTLIEQLTAALERYNAQASGASATH